MQATSPIETKASQYVKPLTDAGVPAPEAVVIARAIARYELQSVTANDAQAQLIRKYFPEICEAGLRRDGILFS